jgi:hypothetical protein
MIPTPQNPLNDPTGANGAVGQSGQVWFLAGTFCTDINCTEGIATRSLAIPAGKALFFPIINSYCSDLVGSGTTEAELRDCAKGGVDLGVGLACEVDGVPIQNLAAYRAVSSLFTFGPVPADNIAGAPAGSTSIAVTDGYWIMLAPLPVGPHSVHFAGAFGPYFSLDVTYHLTITPGEAQAALDNPDESTAPAAGNPGPAGSGATWGRVKSIYR